MDNKIYLELAPISRREYILFHIMLVVVAIAMVLGLVEIWCAKPDTRHITRRDKREIKRIIMGCRSEGSMKVQWSHDPEYLNSYPDPVLESADW